MIWINTRKENTKCQTGVVYFGTNQPHTNNTEYTVLGRQVNAVTSWSKYFMLNKY